jgi:hypothetical protein
MSPTLNLHGTREQKNAAELDPARRWFARSAVMFAATLQTAPSLARLR